MNQTFRQMNEALQNRGAFSEQQMQSLMAAQRGNKRTVIDPDRIDRFPDAEDIVIPGTEQRVGNTAQSEQIVAWMKETGHMPLVYIRLDDGVHVEVSDAFDRRIKAVLAEGKAIGADARRYIFEKGGSDLWPIGGDICVRAICDETGRSDMYGLSFFV